ncbi:WFDC1 protein, partial [Oenanthe oenanthe]|nr:WFDC1 protein [Oenanthe oenanthe]
EMLFCRKVLAAALCALVVLPEPGCARTLWKRALLKMTEKYDVSKVWGDFGEKSKSDQSIKQLSHRPLEEIHDFSITLCPLAAPSWHCGLLFLSSAVLDWLVQPKPRWLGGNGWLLDGPEEVLQAEACSTTEDGDEPLHCPTGYECHIINPGNTAEGVPNRGQCIKQRGNTDGHNMRHKYYKEYFGSNSNNLVGYVKNQQKHLG